MTHSAVFARFMAYIQYLETEQDITSAYELDHYQIKVLNNIFIAQTRSERICVSDVLALKEIASPATLHAALHQLIHKKLVTYKTQKDSRIKLIELTHLGWKRFDELSQFIKTSL